MYCPRLGFQTGIMCVCGGALILVSLIFVSNISLVDTGRMNGKDPVYKLFDKWVSVGQVSALEFAIPFVFLFTMWSHLHHLTFHQTA